MTLEACATGLVAVGCLAAVGGVLVRNVTAGALLASAIFSTVLCELEVPFRPSLWLAIDLTVIMWVLVGWSDKVLQGGYGRKRDVAVLALFAPIWALYFVNVEWRSQAVDALVAAQMLLTFPYRTASERLGRWFAKIRSDGGPLRFAPA